MTTNIVIRRAIEADLGTIASVNTAVFLGDRDSIDSALEWVTCWFKAFPLYQYFIVEVDGVIAGYAGWQIHGGFHRAEPVIELDQIGIAHTHQGQGLGPHLISTCVRELADWIQKKNDRIESHMSFVVWGYTFNFNAMNAYAKQFGDGVCGFRTQFGSRAESMLRLRFPLIRPVRDE
ncbi:MAG: GNAT family N-acetyltransferase [bacterium]|nr:GNAT family N-acetyltransferase [bacterium]